MKQMHLFLWTLLLLLSGCASQGVYLPDGSVLLGEVGHVLTRDQIARNELGPGTKVGYNLRDSLAKQGFTDDQINQGRVIVVNDGFYWNNVVSGIKHLMLNPVLIPNGMCIERGNIVEYRAKGEAGLLPSTILRVRAENLKAGTCHYDELSTGLVKGLLGTVSMVGPSGAATLYCKGIEKEGWQRPSTYWHKLPSAGGIGDVASHADQANPTQQGSICGGMLSTMPSLAARGLATLIIRRPYAFNFSRRDLSVWIGGKKIAELRAGSYTEVTVKAGRHSVSASGEGLMNLPKREIQVLFSPGERIVTQYLVDDSTFKSAGDLKLMFKYNEVAEKAITFGSRPEQPNDEMSLRYITPALEVVE